MTRTTILVVDDEQTQLETLSGYLQKKGFTVIKAENGKNGIAKIRENMVDLVLTDFKMPGMNGLELLQNLRQINPEIAVIVMTAYGSIEDAVEAMRAGAENYLQKPIDLDQLDIIIQKVLENRRLVNENKNLKEVLHTTYHFDNVISGSVKMEEILNLAGRAAQSKATVLIRGESGTGKEVIAKAIHFTSPRKEKPFVAVNVAAVAESLIESEFFGHEKGAFTGADRQRKGRFETADGGTLFIDEIGAIPVSSQVKLLRILQEQAFERVGSSETLKVEVRVIAATNQNIEQMIKDNAFREDLFYRLNVITICIPPLRERKEDIPLFIDYFLRKFGKEEKKESLSISKETMDVLLKYHYPGNVRELENIIQRAVVLSRSDMITRADLPTHLFDFKDEEGRHSERSLVQQVELLEKHLIRNALAQNNGNQSAAARSLKITERNMRYKIKKYNIK